MQSHILLAGVDTLIVNVKRVDGKGVPTKEQCVPSELLEELEDAQQVARSRSKPFATECTFCGARLVMFPNGAPLWKYILRNDCLEVKIAPRLKLSAVAKVTFSSSYLWACGNVREAVNNVHTLLRSLFQEEVFLQAAQIDLCVDMVGLELPANWQEVFVSHARSKRLFRESQKDQEIYRGAKPETILFSGHGNPVSCKIYDKVREIKQDNNKKDWFYKLWKGWDQESDVRRVEYSIEREGLNEMDLDGIYEVLGNIKRLWFYCTHDWLRVVVPGVDATRTRWKTADLWCEVQEAFSHFDGLMVEDVGVLVRKRKREVNIDQGVAAIAGYITTLAAWDNALPNNGDLDTLFSMIRDRVEERWVKTGTDVQSVVTEKKFIYSQKA